MTNKYKGTIIGLIFSVSSWLATWTFVIPFITVLPAGLLLENMFKSIHAVDDYDVIGPSILKALWVIFLTTTILFFTYAFRSAKSGRPASKLSFIVFLLLQLFIVHPLVFYIDTSQNWDRASDGQFILRITETFPLSSIAFVIFGILLDLVNNVARPAQENYSESTET